MKLRNFWLNRINEKSVFKVIEWAHKNNRKIKSLEIMEIIDALKSIDCFKKLHIPIIGMIENMAYLTIKEGWFFKIFFNNVIRFCRR